MGPTCRRWMSTTVKRAFFAVGPLSVSPSCSGDGDRSNGSGDSDFSTTGMVDVVDESC